MLPCPEHLRRRDAPHLPTPAWACPACGQTARCAAATRNQPQHFRTSSALSGAEGRCIRATLRVSASQFASCKTRGQRPASAVSASAARAAAVAAPASGVSLRNSGLSTATLGRKRWKGRADDGSPVSMFDAALQHEAVRHCLHQARRILLEFDEQHSHAPRADQCLHSPGSSRGGRQVDHPGMHSFPARQHLFDALRGRHQRFLRTCLARGELPLALDYIRLLPRNEQLFTALLKEAVMSCSLDQMRDILQARRLLQSFVRVVTLHLCTSKRMTNLPPIAMLRLVIPSLPPTSYHVVICCHSIP